MKNISLASAIPEFRRWLVPAAFVGVLVLSGAGVQSAHAGDKNVEKKVIIESSGEHKAFLGILMQELSDEILEGLDTKVKRGVLVTEVIENSPADNAGIEEGDIIIEFKGRKVDSPDELQDLVAKQEIGDEIQVKVVRGKDTESLEITLGDWADQPSFAWSGDHGRHWDRAMHYVGRMMPRQLGVRISEINGDLGSYFGVDEGEGVLVLDVTDESTAETLGVKAGDVIVEVEGEAIGSAGDIRESLSDVDDGDEVSVTVVRQKKKVALKGEFKRNSNASWFHWRDKGPRVRAFAMPHDEDRDELRRELDELRKELDELKKELEKS